MFLLLSVLFLCGGYARAQSVTVVQLNLPYDEVYSLEINSTVEYILDFTPKEGASREAARVVWARIEGGDGSRPVLVTARQRAGAETWQLPYEVNRRKLYELERTLCPDDARLGTAVTEQRSSYSLHISTSSSASVAFRVRVSIAQAWRLEAPTAIYATQFAPRVLSYQFKGEENRVRLVVSSDSELCATLSVQNYSCPIAQTIDSTALTAEPRLTMMRSGAITIARSQYPSGFYVVLVVHATDEACVSEASIEARAERLWEASLAGELPSYLLPHAPDATERRKDFLVSIQDALSRQEYVVAATVTLTIFLAFYVAFGVLVVAQRWPPFAKLVAPQAVLAHPQSQSGVEEAPGERTTQNSATSPQGTARRLSTNTYDRSDDSDSEDDEPAAAASASPSAPDASASANGVQGPFGLPARLRVAALARHRDHTIRARSDRYLYTLYTVAVFYALPVIQFVIAFQVVMNVSGSLDICYYNFLCAHPAGALSDFNHVFSNLGYLLLGALFMLQVRRRRARRRNLPRDPNYGIPAHYGLLSALGAGMMVVALLSASYHVCPNRLNFQFGYVFCGCQIYWQMYTDTAFMYVLAVLSMVKIYQARHPDVNARAHATFGVLAVIIAFVVWGVLGGGSVFWGVFTVIHVFTFLLLSLRIYYLGQLRFEKQSLAAAASELRRGAKPLYGARLLLLLIANAVNWLFAIYGLIRQGSDFASHMLQVLLGNTLLYMVCYLAMKLVVRERVRWYVWVLLAGATAAWLPALYFFLSGSTNWAATPAASRHSNHDCKVMQFYDFHDLWHLLSAVALYLSFNTMLTWDDGLSAVKRTEIAVF